MDGRGVEFASLEGSVEERRVCDGKMVDTGVFESKVSERTAVQPQIPTRAFENREILTHALDEREILDPVGPFRIGEFTSIKGAISGGTHPVTLFKRAFLKRAARHRGSKCGRFKFTTEEIDAPQRVVVLFIFDTVIMNVSSQCHWIFQCIPLSRPMSGQERLNSIYTYEENE